MTQISSFRELQPFATSASSRPTPTGNKIADWVRSTVRRRDLIRDLIAVVGVCAIGLLLTFAMLTQHQDLSAANGEISLVP